MKIDAQARMFAEQALQQRGNANLNQQEKLKQKAREFEAIFVQQVFKSMRQTIPEGKLLPRGNAEQIYTDFQDMEAAKRLSEQGGIGLAEMLVEQLQKAEKSED